MAQWINLNGNNRSILACQYSVFGIKTGCILQLLVGLMVGRQADSYAGRQTDEIQVRIPQIAEMEHYIAMPGKYM